MSILLVAGACGTDAGGVAIEEPVPTIFPDEPEATDPPETTTTTTTTTTTVPLVDRLPRIPTDGVARVVVSPTGVVAPVLAHLAEGWLVQTPCGNEAELRTGTPVDGAHVVLDPGHGGSEPGAVGENGTVEAELNLQVTLLVAEELESRGVQVVLTRRTDDRYTLATRALTATSLATPAFVSIHHNAAPDGPWPGPGSETWYQRDDPESRRLAGLVYEEVVAALAPFEADWVADTDAGAKFRLNQRGSDYYGILRNAVGVPAVLAELAFLTNPSEERLLTTPEFLAAEARAVADGVVRFLVSDDPGSGFVEAYERVEPAGSGGGTEGCVDPPLE